MRRKATAEDAVTHSGGDVSATQCAYRVWIDRMAMTGVTPLQFPGMWRLCVDGHRRYIPFSPDMVILEKHALPVDDEAGCIVIEEARDEP